MKEINFDQQTNDYYTPKETNPGGGADFDIMHYYRLIMRNLWKIIFFSGVVGGFSLFYAFSLPPVYFSNSTLLIENQQPNVLSFQDVYQVDTRNRDYLGTQLQILKSRTLAARVVDRMRLTRHPAYDPRQTANQSSKVSLDTVLDLLGFRDEEEDTQEISSEEIAIVAESETSEAYENNIRKQLINTVMRSFLIYPVHGTKLVNITFSAPDPVLAADVSNMLAEVYIESHLEAKLEVTQRASAWLGDRLGDLREELRESERALQNFREQEQVVDTGDIRSIDVTELEQLTQNLVEATRDQNDAEARYRQITRKGMSLNDYLALPVVADNAAVLTLLESKVEANRLMVELSKTYGDKHPRMLSALSDLEQVDNELLTQIKSISQGLRVTYRSSIGTVSAIEEQIEVVRARLQDLSRKEFALRELEREVEANRQVYEVFLNRGKETNEAANLDSVNARVIDRALPAEWPDKPEKKKIVMVAILFSGVFAVGVLLLLDWLDNTIKTPEDVEERLGVPLLGHLPLDKTNKDDAPFIGFLSDQKWHFAESVRTIRTSFILSCLDQPAKITVITSSVPNEGKSTVSLCLSHALGQMEKVLLVDADMRKPSIGKALDISLLTPGLSNLIAGTANLEECVSRLPNSEVDVMTAGVVLGNPLDLLASERFVETLEMLKSKYDRIIIDSAPIQAVSDSIVIATHADALIYVVKSDGSSTPMIKKGLRRLSETSARFAGVVLNQVDIDKMKKQSGYESEYYENYGYAYGDTNNT